MKLSDFFTKEAADPDTDDQKVQLAELQRELDDINERKKKGMEVFDRQIDRIKGQIQTIRDTLDKKRERAKLETGKVK